MTELAYPDCVEAVNENLDDVGEEHGVNISVDNADIDAHIREYVQKRVQPEKAVSHVTNKILEKAGLEDSSYGSGETRQQPVTGTDEELNAAEIRESGRWITFTGVVIETYDTKGVDSLTQQGLIADHTGSTRFTVWDNSNVDVELEVGETYEINSVVTTEHRGKYELKLTGPSSVERKTDEMALDIDPATYTETIKGTVTDLQSQMGIITRCNNCDRVLDEEHYCPDCGEVDSYEDLRTKMVVDTGENTFTVFLGEEMTESVAHLSFDQAKKIEAKGTRADVKNAIATEVHGEYVRAEGRDRGEQFNVEEIEKLRPPTKGSFEQARDKVQEML